MTNKRLNYKFCVSIGEKSQQLALQAAQDISSQADVIEIRLDCMDTIQVAPFLKSLNKPTLFTNRPKWEGGSFLGDESDRIAPLVEAVNRGAAYIDLEYLSTEKSLLELKKHLGESATQLILSSHNFELTPTREQLLEVMMGMYHKGADIGKIITTAHGSGDVLRVLQLIEDAAVINFPLIAFCMGKAGAISRLATLEYGGYMTYCSAKEGSDTAPGQIPVTTLREMCDLTSGQ